MEGEYERSAAFLGALEDDRCGEGGAAITEDEGDEDGSGDGNSTRCILCCALLVRFQLPLGNGTKEMLMVSPRP